jgi:hypothetical protein
MLNVPVSVESSSFVFSSSSVLSVLSALAKAATSSLASRIETETV